MDAEILEVALSECSAEDFDGEVVALNHDTGVYFCMKDTAAVLWHDLAAGHSVQALSAIAAGNPELAQSIKQLAMQLVEAGLLRPAESSSGPSVPPRLTSALAADAPLPVLESFDDMKKLMLLDPVHEVDEDSGWPGRRQD